MFIGADYEGHPFHIDRKMCFKSPPVILLLRLRPKAALLFWLFGDFKCGVCYLLFFLLYT